MNYSTYKLQQSSFIGRLSPSFLHVNFSKKLYVVRKSDDISCRCGNLKTYIAQCYKIPTVGQIRIFDDRICIENHTKKTKTNIYNADGYLSSFIEKNNDDPTNPFLQKGKTFLSTLLKILLSILIKIFFPLF